MKKEQMDLFLTHTPGNVKDSLDRKYLDTCPVRRMKNLCENLKRFFFYFTSNLLFM